MYFHMLNITNPMYIQYLGEVILPAIHNVAGIRKHITIFIFYQVSSRLIILLKSN
jgi:hypothetical protein